MEKRSILPRLVRQNMRTHAKKIQSVYSCALNTSTKFLCTTSDNNNNNNNCSVDIYTNTFHFNNAVDAVGMSGMTMCERRSCSSSSNSNNNLCHHSSLCCATRHFTSFEGTHKEFAEEIKSCGDAVIVFFYRPICAPCAAIRSKIIDVADSLSGRALKRKSDTRTTIKKTDNSSNCDNSSKSIDNNNAIESSQEQHKETFNTEKQDPIKQDVVEKEAEMPKEVKCTHETNGSDTRTSNSNETGSSHMVMSDEDLATCHQVQANVDKEFAKALQNVKFLTVDTTRNELLTALHDVRSLPTFIAYRNGRIIGRVEGAHDNELTELLQIVKKDESEQEKLEMLKKQITFS